MKILRSQITITCIATTITLAATAFAVSPPPDGGYPHENTAEGEDALFNLTTGTDNTATGFKALFNTTTGFENTANGAGALFSNKHGSQNTATGYQALSKNEEASNNTADGAGALMNNAHGNDNTALGHFALQNNKFGNWNTATGSAALASNIAGSQNTATGFGALFDNRTGNANTATGFAALDANTTGYNNTATGNGALELNRTGDSNTAVGYFALLYNIHGSNNIALGYQSGTNLTQSDNIDIGNVGVAGDANTIRIGTVGTHNNTFTSGVSGVTVAAGVSVVIDDNGQLGTVTSSERFKDAIKPMDKASEAILSLKPVTFRYKHELDPAGIPQFGLVAEQVEKVNPDLVARDEQGKPYTVRYEAVNAMLLNEFLKEHGTVQELKTTVSKQETTIAQQEKEIEALSAALKAQAAQIQKVSDRLAASEAAPPMLVKNR